MTKSRTSYRHIPEFLAGFMVGLIETSKFKKTELRILVESLRTDILEAAVNHLDKSVVPEFIDMANTELTFRRTDAEHPSVAS